MINSVILLGAGGHAKVIYEALLSMKQYIVAAYIGQPHDDYFGSTCLEQLVNDESIFYKNEKLYLANGFGVNKNRTTRKAIFSKFKKRNYTFINVVHPSAMVSDTAVLLEGVQVLAQAIVQADSHIGDNTIINHGVIIDHEVNVGDHCHISPGAILGGGVSIGDNVFIGSGAVVLPSLNITQNVVVGAGAVVTKDICMAGTYVGSPAKALYNLT